ncbi:MAG: hypothetical protein M1812_005072 [Candelaria pacifica]|nr:MAG: hypothetical protein M1812_005072 [Candelaria pacifica]
MADGYAPPSGPPPPKVPEGWKAVYNTQYNEWFYVNIYTKVSQWDKPTSPIYPSDNDHSAPAGPPPGYTPNTSTSDPHFNDTKTLSNSNNPYNTSSTTNDDAALAARLQAEENARANPTSRGNAQQEYMNTPLPPNANISTYPSDLPPRPQERSHGASGGILGKLLGKAGGSHQPQQGYGGGGYPGPQGYPPQGYPYGGYPQGQNYGGGYGGGGYGGGGTGFMQQKPKRGGGLGMGGAAALGAGGGLLGGALLAEGMEHHDEEERQDGYNDAMDDRDDGGYGGGGDDYGGGDDFGGGDF